MHLGPPRFVVSARGDAARRPFEHRLVVREHGFAAAAARDATIQQLYGMLAADHDHVDAGVSVLLKMFEKRLRGYRAIGYARGEAPLGIREEREPVGERFVECDEDASEEMRGRGD
jgi:hypothetical protein